LDTALTVSIVSGVIALASAGVTVWGSRFSTLRTIQHDAAKEKARLTIALDRIQNPMTVAAYDLQSRLYNIIELGFFERFYDFGSDRQRTYAVENTTFLIAQYLCWTELVRREIQGSGYASDVINHRAITQQDLINGKFGNDADHPCLMIFAGEQRAIGEALITNGPHGLECMGYRQFLSERGVGVDYLLDAVRVDVESLSKCRSDAMGRLKALHDGLISYLEYVDPEYNRFPASHRKRISFESSDTGSRPDRP
jgi:hypothetical protein